MSKEAENIGRRLGTAARRIMGALSTAVALYLVFAVAFSTPEERRLQRENELYALLYPTLKEQEKLVSDVVEGLLVKDNAIYRELFETEAPSLNPTTAADLIPDSDSLSESFYLTAASSKTESLMLMAGNVDEAFREVFRVLEERRDSIPPLSLPLKGMSYVQTGASTGVKHNPVYKVEMQHDGIDLIVPQGEPVFAAAAGTVTALTHSRKGLGNQVEIDHGNGYTTCYALLGDISVQKGRKVRQGQKIGTVGVSAGMFSPHLHYEVRYKGQALDPVNHLFASIGPDEYAKMLYMSVSTAQSMD